MTEKQSEVGIIYHIVIKRKIHIVIKQRFISGLAKWISKWGGHGTLKSTVGHGWPTRKISKF